jgi:3-oxoacyl-[acyl-carrier-protein] synthase II
VTGIGLVTPVGVGVKASWDALVSGATGVRALQKGDLPPAHQALLNQLPSRVGALVPRDQLSHALTQLQEVGGCMGRCQRPRCFRSLSCFR